MQAEMFDNGEDDRAAWAEAQAAFTPTGVVRQHVQRAIVAGDRPPPRRILDVGAGRGVFGQVCRQLFPEAMLVAVELRPEERPHLVEHYDQVITGSFDSRPVRKRVRQLGPFDLAIGNPPFGVVRDRLGTPQCWHAAIVAELEARGELHWLLPVDMLWRTGATCEWFADHPLAAMWVVAGRLAMLGGSGLDHRTYAWHVWDRSGRTDPRWPMEMHPLLPASARRWSKVPGDTR